MSLWQPLRNNSLRLVISVLLALALSVVLFLLMNSLINPDNRQIQHRNAPLMVDISQVKAPIEEQKRQQPKPKEPPPPLESISADAPSPSNLAISEQLSASDLQISVPQWENNDLAIEQRYWSAPVAGAGSGAQAGYLGEADTGQKEIVPIATRRPNIPKVAYDNQVNGWVLLAFTVANNGRVKNIRVMDAEPRGIFEANAVAAVKSWIYTPFKGEERHISQRIEFEWTMYSYNMNFE